MKVCVSDLNFDYNDKSVLNDISFTVENGELLLVLGHNGAGKTTLINILLKKLTPKSGDIFYDEQRLEDFSDFTKIGYVPQEVEISGFPITVNEFLLVFNRNKSKDEVEEVLKKLDIMHLKNKSMVNLSGGERRRTYIARSLLNDISLLIMDEPLTAIDKESIILVKKMISEIKEKNIPIILITHNFMELYDEATKVLEIEGNVKFFGTKEDYKKEGEHSGNN